MITHGSTLKGIRKENQDRYLIYSPNDQFTLLAVADGMGGLVGGGTASQIVIDTTQKVIRIFYEDWKTEHNLKSILQNIFYEAQLAIRKRIIEEPALEGMGSTLCCLLIYKDQYVWGNIGDSRIYHFSGDSCSRITKDHTQIEEYNSKENNDASIEIVRNYGHILTKTINGGNDRPDIYPQHSPAQKLNKGEGFLLCSDGLLLDKYGHEEERFYKYFVESKTISEFIENLIFDAYEMGSKDNITCVATLNSSNN